MSQTNGVPDEFSGYAAHDEKAGKALDLKPYKYTPQKWHEALIDIKITHCSICGSCLHTLKSAVHLNTWPSPTQYPAICGHEIIGIVVKAGQDSGHKVGSRVGVGAQSGSCGSCVTCKSGHETYCEKGFIGTYQGKWEDGSIAQVALSLKYLIWLCYNRATEFSFLPMQPFAGGVCGFRACPRFAIEIPKELSSETAAPMMCAGKVELFHSRTTRCCWTNLGNQLGITTYNPIKTGGAGPGKKVAIVGIGGLGHLGIQWAKALGADVYAISHSDSKKDDAEKLGVKEDHFIISKDLEATTEKWKNTFDLIVSTSNQHDLPVDKLFFPLLKSQGRLTIVGLPEEKIPAFYGHALVMKGISFGGSLIGPPSMIKEMLDVAVKHNVKSWTSSHPMSEVTRYRYVMTNP
ncbi:hypothetical protein VP01_1023g5 [Puccinia sorghi]|uniref:Enoyl reductase (ER) domain-containing protein n=1 Tax=Puccinia sorghi TaxID=27349 RepID=A0A0L6VV40_9BASI|nr:hypothetical protein VP01_1023g5 [Puccinia sorghi]